MVRIGKRVLLFILLLLIMGGAEYARQNKIEFAIPLLNGAAVWVTDEMTNEKLEAAKEATPDAPAGAAIQVAPEGAVSETEAVAE